MRSFRAQGRVGTRAGHPGGAASRGPSGFDLVIRVTRWYGGNPPRSAQQSVPLGRHEGAAEHFEVVLAESPEAGLAAAPEVERRVREPPAVEVVPLQVPDQDLLGLG